MSRRRLEAAIKAARILEKDDNLVAIYEKAEVYKTYQFEAVRDGIYCLQYSYEGSSLIVGYGDGGIELISSENGTLVRELQRHRLGGLAVTCLRFCPLNHQLVYAASCEGQVTAYDTRSNLSQDVVTEPNNEIQCIDFSLEGNRFATAGRDLTVRVYDTGMSTCIQSYAGYNYNSPDQPQEAGHAQRVFALKYHPQNNDIFITGGWDNHLKVWDTRTRAGIIKTIHGPHLCGDSLDLKGDLILTGSWVVSNGLQLWDFGSGQLMQTFQLDHIVKHPRYPGDKEKGEYFYCAQFGGDDFIFAGGSGINNALVINIHTSQVLSEITFGQTIQAIDSTNNGHVFSVGGVACELKLAKIV